jgi:hypothetical protein
MGIFSGILSTLGGAAGIGSSIVKGIGGLAASAAGSFLGRSIDRYGDNRAMRDQWDFYASQGLTPQEIMGAGGVGTGSSAGSTVLGNQAAQQAQMEQQRAYEKAENEKNRALGLSGQMAQLESAQTMAGASMYSADRAADASKYNTDINSSVNLQKLAFDVERFQKIDVPAEARRAVTESPEFIKSRVLATMSADNQIATTISRVFGVDPFLKEGGPTVDDLAKMMVIIQGMQSDTFKKGAGLVLGADLGNRLTFGRGRQYLSNLTGLNMPSMPNVIDWGDSTGTPFSVSPQ